MKTAAQLSEIEQKVYDIIKASGSIWQYKITDQLWPRVIYSPTTQAAYWQQEADYYGFEVNRPVMGENTLFTPSIPVSYNQQVITACISLSKKGLIQERNNGYNEYSYCIK